MEDPDETMLAQSDERRPEPNILVRFQTKLRSLFPWSLHHFIAFMLTFFSYALFHASRKSFSNVKTTISSEWTPECTNLTNLTCNPGHAFDDPRWDSHRLFAAEDNTEDFLGILDTVFLSCYAVGLFISGAVGDRYDPRIVLSVGMCASSIVLFIFGYLTEVVHFYNVYFYAFVWAISGFVQSSGWPNEVSVMGNWFGLGTRGLVLGLWSACASIGNIIGSYMAGYFLQFGYEYVFLVNSVLMACGGVVIFCGLVSAPRQIGLSDPHDGSLKDLGDLGEVASERPKAISICRAFVLPGVLAYALAYACLKLVNYSFFFWLPYYLHSRYGWDESVADQLSTWYDWGGVVSGFLAGIITDLMGCRTPVIFVMLLAAVGALWGYKGSPNNKMTNSFLMSIAGFFIGGPANLIAGAVSADLGKHPDLHGNAEAIATVTGVLDGTGSIGAALGQILVPVLNKKFHNWSSVFYLFIAMTFATALCLVHLAFKESKKFVLETHEKCSRWREGKDVDEYSKLLNDDEENDSNDAIN